MDSAVTLDQLAAFRAVAESGSFSAAARRLGRAQSAVSYQVANLEELLAVKLFDRSHRRPRLTEAGQALLVEATAVSAKVADLLSRAKEIAGGLEPEVSLAVDMMFPLPRLSAALTAFREQFPQLPIRLQTEALGGVIQLLVEGICDLGIGPVFPAIPGELEHRQLTQVKMITVAAASHPLTEIESSQTPLQREQLDDYPQLVLTDRSRFTAGLMFGVAGGPSWKIADLPTKTRFAFGGPRLGQHARAHDRR
jgi:DNA-binding transcriptional LysR family regulator